jgi:hypothetical protein
MHTAPQIIEVRSKLSKALRKKVAPDCTPLHPGHDPKRFERLERFERFERGFYLQLIAGL